MATLWTIDWTASNGTKWTADNVYFEKIMGTTSVLSLIAEVRSNKGWCKPSASNERQMYRPLAFAPIRDRKTRCTLDWKSAGSSRVAGIGDRFTADNLYGYGFEVDMASGAPTFRVFRRVNGSETNLGGTPTTLDPLGPSDLMDDALFEIRLETFADRVNVRASINGTVLLDVDDTSVVRIESGGTAVVLIGHTCKDDDVTFDNLTCLDFEDEATSGTDYQTGLGLSINGTYLSEQEIIDRGIVVRSATQSYKQEGSVGTLDDVNDAHEPALQLGDWVQILWNNVVLAEGPIRYRAQRFQPPEGVGYEITSPRELGNNVPIENPNTGGGLYPFNQETDNENYDAELADKEVGQMLARIWDDNAEGDDGLRAHGAAPATGPLYDDSDLTDLDVKPPHYSLSGFVTQAEETAISVMPQFAIFLVPGTRLREIHNRTTSPIVGLDFQAGWLSAEITVELSGCKTWFLVRGGKAQSVAEILGWGPGGTPSEATLAFDPAWDRNVEASHQPGKAWKEKDQTTIVQVGVISGGAYDGHLYIDVATTPFQMDPDEWNGTYAGVLSPSPGAGGYRILKNTASRLILAETAWIGSDPVMGDGVAVYGTHENPNQHGALGRDFYLPEGYKLASGVCGGNARISQVNEKGQTEAMTVGYKAIRGDPDATGDDARDKIRLDAPVIGLINRAPDLCENADGSSGTQDSMFADSVTAEIPVTPTGVKAAKKRVPEKGWTGSAFSPNPAKYGTGQRPGPGDPGVMTPYVVEDANYISDALQGAEYEKWGQAVLEIYGKISYAGTITIEAAEDGGDGIDVQWVGLNKRIQLADTGKRILGYEDVEDLLLLQVTWDFQGNKTTLAVGTLGNGSVSIDAVRSRYVEKTRLDAAKAAARLYEEMRNCLKDSMSGAGKAPGDSAAATSACNVTASYNYGNKKERVKQSELQVVVKECTVQASQAITSCLLGCGPMSSDIAKMIANGHKFDGIKIRAEVTKKFNSHLDANGAVDPAHAASILEAVCCLSEHVGKLWLVMAKLLSAVDQEFTTVRNDFANVRLALDAITHCVYVQDKKICDQLLALQACLNDKLDQIDFCFTHKKDEPDQNPCGLEHCELPCVPDPCPNPFTEQTCENACKVEVPDACKPGSPG